jgi:hypothetical protein
MVQTCIHNESGINSQTGQDLHDCIICALETDFCWDEDGDEETELTSDFFLLCED